MEYLVTMITVIPRDVDASTVKDTHDREIRRVEELAAADHMLRLWKPPVLDGTPPAETRTLGLFKASGDAALDALLQSLPMHVWSRFEIVPLEYHAHDPERGT